MYGPDGKLGIEDAHFVIALHTSDILGITYCYGHVDFFPNGGCDQWGCDSGQYLIGSSASYLQELFFEQLNEYLC